MMTPTDDWPPVKDHLIATTNRMGYMMAEPDALNQAFIDFAATCRRPVLEMGCAYGVATLPALARGATVFANDLSEDHLCVLWSRVPPEDENRLIPQPGPLEDLSMTDDSLDGVLASRVLNFLPPDQIRKTIGQIYQWLHTGGKAFLLWGSPYMGTYRQFLPQYQENCRQGRPWPGFMEDIRPYTLPERSAHLPRRVTLVDLDEVRTLMIDAGFELEDLAYASVHPHNPDIMKGDGREYIRAIGVKR